MSESQNQQTQTQESVVETQAAIQQGQPPAPVDEQGQQAIEEAESASVKTPTPSSVARDQVDTPSAPSSSPSSSFLPSASTRAVSGDEKSQSATTQEASAKSSTLSGRKRNAQMSDDSDDESDSDSDDNRDTDADGLKDSPRIKRAPKKRVNDKKIIVEVHAQDGTVKKFQLFYNTEFRRVRESYCKQMNLHVSDVRFLYDSERLDDHDTPRSKTMEPSAIIYAVSDQTGGSQWRYRNQLMSRCNRCRRVGSVAHRNGVGKTFARQINCQL